MNVTRLPDGRLDLGIVRDRLPIALNHAPECRSYLPLAEQCGCVRCPCGCNTQEEDYDE